MVLGPEDSSDFPEACRVKGREPGKVMLSQTSGRQKNSFSATGPGYRLEHSMLTSSFLGTGTNIFLTINMLTFMRYLCLHTIGRYAFSYQKVDMVTISG